MHRARSGTGLTADDHQVNSFETHSAEPPDQWLDRQKLYAGLPAYAPDHNPVEFLWSYLKHDRPPNFVPASLSHLDQSVRYELDAVRQTPGLLKALRQGSKLPFPPCIFA